MFKDFLNEVLGRRIDVDGAYGPQCVDLFNYWNKKHNNTYINCRPSGFAKSLAYNKKNNGILNYFKETAVNNMIEGTVVVWGNCKVAPYSHVAFFIKDNGNGTFQALHQNVNGRNYVVISNITYNGIIGAFIPNQLVKTPVEAPKTTIPKGEAVDQILHVGSKVRFRGTQIDYIYGNTFTSKFYTGNGRRDYHLIPLNDFYRVGGDGNRYPNQQKSVGNWLMNDNVYTVEKIDLKTDSAKIHVNGKYVWIYCNALVEV